jgi:Domain of unknown function (DUF4329)
MVSSSGVRTIGATNVKHYLALVVLSAAAHAADVPLSVMDAAQTAYADADDAATAALAESARLSRDVEYAGAVYYVDGAYHYTVPVTTGDARDVSGYRIAITRRGTVVALYHTHPTDLTNDQSDMFSAADVDTAKAMHVVSYVGVLKSGRVIQFDYRHDKAHALLDSAHVNGGKVSAGHAVGLFTASN